MAYDFPSLALLSRSSCDGSGCENFLRLLALHSAEISRPRPDVSVLMPYRSERLRLSSTIGHVKLIEV